MHQEQPSRKLTTIEVQEHFEDQIDFLETAADEFDARGKTNRAKQMAGIIRTLVHHTAQSHSLISQMGLSKRKFLSSGPEIDGKNLLPECDLLALGFSTEGVRYMAPLDPSPMRFVKLEDWWMASVLDDKQGNVFSRKDLVLFMANKDGGSHVDPNIPLAYARFRDSGLGFELKSGNKLGVYPERFAVRQIAHEVLKSLNPRYSKVLTLRGNLAVISNPRAQLEPIGDPEHYADTTPSADACPCESGEVFAGCHQLGARSLTSGK